MQRTIDRPGITKNEFNILRLTDLLDSDLDFHDQASNYSSHNFHAFAAKFPPQLPSKFISELTKEGDIVLDPMIGSGTTILEAYLSGRFGIGYDIDPLALMIAKVKVTPLDISVAKTIGRNIINEALYFVTNRKHDLEEILSGCWDPKTKEFVDYWFEHETQIELMSILLQIKKITNEDIRRFFELTLSATIITKSGGVSLALDLAHTRPHRAKTVIHKVDRVREDKSEDKEVPLNIYSTKYLHSAIWEFNRKLEQNINGLPQIVLGVKNPEVKFCNAKNLDLNSNCIDLIVTSPPYPSNAIDYMRAHKFSLVWLGYAIEDLKYRRQKYIGSDAPVNKPQDRLPHFTTDIILNISDRDKRKGLSLNQYYSEMQQTLREMYRVLKPGKAAIVVVGSSIVKGINTQTSACLKEIGEELGFICPKIGVRKLDRNRRMMPVKSNAPDKNSQIQQRMHEEHVIGFYKPLL